MSTNDPVNCTIDVPLPAGSHAISTWKDWDNEYRVIWTPGVQIANICVCGSAIQLPDGSVDAAGVVEAPMVTIGESQVTVAQARGLAAAIVATAELIEGWTR